MIFHELEGQVIDHLNKKFKGKAEAKRIHTNDVPEVTIWMRDNLRSIGSFPHALVYCGLSQETQRDSSNLMPSDEFDVEVFLATRDSSTENEAVQKKLADRWTVITRAALSDLSLGTDVTSQNVVDDYIIERHYNLERASLSQITGTVTLAIDHEKILNSL